MRAVSVSPARSGRRRKGKGLQHRIAVLGGSGFVGRGLAGVLGRTATASPIYVVHRREPDWLHRSGVEVKRCALDDVERLKPVLAEASVVVNLLRPDGSGDRLRALEAIRPLLTGPGAPSLIHASSIDVYGNARGTSLTERSKPCPASPYASEQLAIERLLQTHPACCVLRLGAIFGDGGRNVASFAPEVARARRPILLARRLLYGARRMHLVSLEAVVAVILHLIGMPPGDRPSHLLVTDDDDERNHFAFVQDRLLEAFGRPSLAQLPQLPHPCLETALRLRARPHRMVRRRFVSCFAPLLAEAARPDFGDSLAAYARQLAQTHLRR